MYYCVVKGRIPGIYDNWFDCKIQVNKFPNAKFKKFKNYFDAFCYLQNIKDIKNISEIDHKTEENIINVYTDGSCINNGTDFAKAGIGIYFEKNDPRNISERITGKQTNNIAELKAAIKVAEIVEKYVLENDKLIINIFTDSKYSIN